MELLNALGVDIKLLIAQLINFLIFAGLLYKFGYKPILKFAKERQEKIEKGLRHADEASTRLIDAEKKREHMLAEAHTEAQAVITRATDHAKQQADGMIAKTKDEARAIVERAKKEIRLEQDKSIAEVREQAASLVLRATEKLLQHKLDAKTDAAYIKDVLQKL